MEIILGLIGLAVGFWLLTSKKFRKENGAVVSHFVGESLNGLSDSSRMNNITSFQEFKAELKDEFNIDIKVAQEELMSFRKGV